MKSNPKIKSVAAEEPSDDVITAAAGVIRRGGMVVFPTTGLYGLGAEALDERTVARVFEIKQRPFDKPILVLIHEFAQLQLLTETIPVVADTLMNHFWPGRVTLVFQARKTLPAGLTGDSGKIGIRLAGHPVAVQLLKAISRPLTGTSANLSGQPGCASISELDQAIADQCGSDSGRRPPRRRAGLDDRGCDRQSTDRHSRRCGDGKSD